MRETDIKMCETALRQLNDLIIGRKRWARATYGVGVMSTEVVMLQKILIVLETLLDDATEKRNEI